MDKIAISNIAWEPGEDKQVAELMRSLGVKNLEVAPTKLWQDPTTASNRDIEAVQSFWSQYGIGIVAFQSMLFNRPDLKIFETSENRAATADFLKKFIRLAAAMGAHVLVFGSPKNRQRGSMGYAQAFEIATAFFKELGDEATKHHVKFCIEPNPKQYNCDFVTNTKQGIELVKAVGSAGFGLHLDMAGLSLAGDDIKTSIKNAADVLEHFHISAPFLDQVAGRDDVDYQTAAQTLKEINYQGYMSIEMRPGDGGQNVGRVRTAIDFAQATFA